MKPTVVAVVVALVALLGSLPFAGPSNSFGRPSSVAGTGPEASAGSVALSPPGRLDTVQVAPSFAPSNGTVSLGPLPSVDPLSVEVGLAMPDPSALAGLVSALYTPGTPEYHHFLSPSELARAYGPSAATVSAAEAYFERFGLSATASPDRLLLTVTGPSTEVGRAFGTSFEEYRTAGGRLFFSHPTAATLPPIVPWSGALGLGNVTPFVPAAGEPIETPAAVAPSAACLGTGSTLLPCQVWQAYGFASLIANGTNGSGFRLAVVDPYSSSETETDLTDDLATFASDTGIAVGSVDYLYPDGASGNMNVSTNTAWALEDTLDLEWVRAAAPGATVEMVFSPNDGAGLYEAVDWLVAHQAADVISLSWGEPDVGVFNAFSTPCTTACNASTDGSYGVLSPVLEFAAAEGISVFSASGDCGAADGTSGVSTNFPASDPYVTGVGGTVLTVDQNGDYVSEVAWSGNASGASSPGCTNQGGSGGGYSPFPRPWWQDGITHPPPSRGVPDVALDAATPAFLILHGSSVGAAGTSLSTPVWAGIATIADQYVGSPLGFLNPTLYAIAAGTNYSHDFHDIVTGGNGYPAGPGWDPVTGLGTPEVSNLVVNLAHPVPVPSSDLVSFVYATPRFGKAPLTVTFHVNATGGTGTYPLEGVSFGDGNASYAVEGVVSHTYAMAGVYSAEAYVADSTGNYSVSPPLAIVVGGGGALGVSLAASTDVPSRGASVAFTATVTGGHGPYLYNFTFGDGTWVTASTTSTNHTFGADGGFCAEVVVFDSATPPDGGASGRLAIAVGGAPLPNCQNDSTPLTVTAVPEVGVRDAPADFPDLFSVAGGSTRVGTLPPSVQYASTDPYLSACGCAIFRSAGDYRVTGYANDSENEEANATTNVTVAPPIVANFSASPTFGVAPLTVRFEANASGGDGVNASSTVWKFGNGTEEVGRSLSVTFTTPGFYLVVGHLSDLGDGNASRAFLLDVSAPSAPPPFFLTATVSPAVDLSLGMTVNLSAQAYALNGSVDPARFLWSIGSGSGGYRPSLNWTFSSPLPAAADNVLALGLNVTDFVSGDFVNATVPLADFAAVEPGGFTPRADDLAFSDEGGPSFGKAPVDWTGTGNATGPGVVLVDWLFGGFYEVSGSVGEHNYSAGVDTVVAVALDTWGDRAVDVHPVTALGPVALTASLSTLNGPVPLSVSFRASGGAGIGPPYRYFWRFGDGSTASAGNGTHTFGASGVYEVSVVVTDTAGDLATMHWNVSANPASSAYLPELFLLVGASAGAVAAVIAAVSLRRRAPPQPTPSL